MSNLSQARVPVRLRAWINPRSIQKLQGSITMQIRNIGIKNSILLTAMSSVLIPAVSLAASDVGTLLVGQRFNTLPPRCITEDWGYAAGEFGSYSPTGLTGGRTVDAVYGVGGCGGSDSTATLAVTGFTSNPGQAWLTSITCNGVALIGTAAASYFYSAGQATWNWGTPFGLSSKVGSNVSCTIVHS